MVSKEYFTQPTFLGKALIKLGVLESVADRRARIAAEELKQKKMEVQIHMLLQHTTISISKVEYLLGVREVDICPEQEVVISPCDHPEFQENMYLAHPFLPPHKEA